MSIYRRREQAAPIQLYAVTSRKWLVYTALMIAFGLVCIQGPEGGQQFMGAGFLLIALPFLAFARRVITLHPEQRVVVRSDGIFGWKLLTERVSVQREHAVVKLTVKGKRWAYSVELRHEGQTVELLRLSDDEVVERLAVRLAEELDLTLLDRREVYENRKLILEEETPRAYPSARA